MGPSVGYADLHAVLDDIRQGQVSRGSPLFDLFVVKLRRAQSEHAPTSAESQAALASILRELVASALAERRRTLGLNRHPSYEPATAEEQLRRDFGASDRDLERWSAVHYRY